MTNREVNHQRKSCDSNNETKSLDKQIDEARQELQLLRQNRQANTIQRARDIKQRQQKYDETKQNLDTKMKTRPSFGLLLQGLKNRHLEKERKNIPSQYVLKKEALWMTNMMHAFFVLQRQRVMVEEHHEEMERYVMKERVRIFVELDDANQEALQQVTKVAEEYSAGYDQIQYTLDDMATQIKELSAMLPEKQSKDDDSTAYTGDLTSTDHSDVLGSGGSFETFDSDNEDIISFAGDLNIGSRFADLSHMFQESVSSFRTSYRDIPRSCEG